MRQETWFWFFVVVGLFIIYHLSKSNRFDIPQAIMGGVADEGLYSNYSSNDIMDAKGRPIAPYVIMN